jgi:hypothetical protein
MEKLAAAHANVYIKISMLCYTCKEWDTNPLVVETIYKVIEIFGASRCFFASNYPVDIKDGWPVSHGFLNSLSWAGFLAGVCCSSVISIVVLCHVLLRVHSSCNASLVYSHLRIVPCLTFGVGLLFASGDTATCRDTVRWR